MKKILSALMTGSILALIAIPSPARAQEKIKVLSDGPLRPALIQIGEAFHRDRGPDVEFLFETSPVVHKKVIDGEAGDVLLIQPNFIEELVKSGKVIAGEHPVIGRVSLGLAARADAPTRDISTTEALKQLLLSADSIVFNNLASGNNFVKVLERLNIGEAVKAKIVRVGPGAVFERIMQGQGNDVGVGTIPQIRATKGLKLIGALPAELQIPIVYAAAPMTSAKSLQAAKMFIDFLTAPASKIIFAAAGFE
jgi:molybdate transport system substrate-binding protein